MTCHEFWDQMPELAAGSEQPEHVQDCPSCAALLQRQRALAGGLHRLARESSRNEAPAALETRLLAAFRTQARARPVPVWRYRLAWASAAALLVAAILVTVNRQVHRNPVSNATVSTPAAVDLAGLESDFIPLPYGVTDAGVVNPAEDADLVRVEVPRSALIALGVPVAEGGESIVEAVVALGTDGTLRGIEVLQ